MNVSSWQTEMLRLGGNVAARWPDDRGTQEKLGEVERLADSITHHRPLAERYNDPGDGLRSPSTDGGSRSKGTHADPVYVTVVAGLPTYDPDHPRFADRLRLVDAKLGNAVLWLRRTERTALDNELLRDRRLREVLAQLSEARAILHALLPPPGPVTARLHPQGDKGCLSHRKAGVFVSSEKGRHGVCRWCADFQRSHHRLPPPELVQHHDAGYPLNPEMVARALAKKKPPTPKAKPKRPPSRREKMLTRVHEAIDRIRA